MLNSRYSNASRFCIFFGLASIATAIRSLFRNNKSLSMQNHKDGVGYLEFDESGKFIGVGLRANP